MITRLIILSVLVVASHGQGMSAGPFTLLDDLATVKTHCNSMTLMAPAFQFERYIVDNGDDTNWVLWFKQDVLLQIVNSTIVDSRDNYYEAVEFFSIKEGRRPDLMYVMAGTAYNAEWEGPQSKIIVSYYDNDLSFQLVYKE